MSSRSGKADIQGSPLHAAEAGRQTAETAAAIPTIIHFVCFITDADQTCGKEKISVRQANARRVSQTRR